MGEGGFERRQPRQERTFDGCQLEKDSQCLVPTEAVECTDRQWDREYE
jgi:hypothetical protein